MRRLLQLCTLVDRLNRAVARGVAWLLLLMVLVGAGNAVSRYAFALPSNALLELQWYLFSLAFLLGAPYALRRSDHVRVDVLSSGLPERGRWWLDLVGGLVLLIPFCAFTILISRDFVLDSWAERETSNDPGGLPRWPLKPFVPLAFLLLLLQGLAEVVRRIALLRGVPPAAAGLDAPSAGEGPL